MATTITAEVSRLIRKMHEYTDTTTFDKNKLLELLTELEDLIDMYLTGVNYGEKITDMKFKAVKAVIDEYVELVKTIKRSILEANVTELRDQLIELDTKIRDMLRTINLLRADNKGVAAFEILEETGYSFGMDELSELDTRINRLSPTAKRVVKAVIDSPIKAVSLAELARRCGMVDEDGRPSARFAKVIEELLSTIPELISIEPSKGGSGTIIRWRGW